MVTDTFFSTLAASSRRWERRTAERDQTRQVLNERGVLYADEPERLEKRLGRLGASLGLAKAIEETPAVASTGRSLDETLAPEDFGADILGLERLMGRNDLVDVGFLERGHLASGSVGRVNVSSPEAHYGSGFMVSPRLLLTNNHVLRDPDEAARGCVEFNFQAGLDGRALQPVAFRFEPHVFFVTSKELDFTFVAVTERDDTGAQLSDFGWLQLIEEQGKIVLGEFVNVIQHPNGEPKQLALRENRLVDRLENFLHYETDTAPGSSGSPVFNDQWEVVALHHSGVPRKDQEGNYLAIDGGHWTPDMGEHRLDWKANEGVRISRVARALREEPLTGSPEKLRAQLFEAVSPAAAQPDRAAASRSAGIALGGEHAQPSTSVWTLPLRVSVTLGGEGEMLVPTARVAAEEDPELRAALVDAAAAQARPYYDEDADRAARESYYEHIEADQDGANFYRALSQLLERSHQPRPAYKPSRLVYPWLDLHPDGLLRSLYSGKTFTAEELIRADAAVEAARTERLEEFVRRESAVGPRELEAELDTLEAALPFNCEHVVPQSWFAKQEPMRGDLHHLFACESGCNSFRGNFPYFDFVDDEEATRHECGRREAEGFEPAAGRGPAARATLYFLLRYPGFLGDAERELTEDRLPLLLDWHRDDPVGLYERHRNAASAELQGARNPLIDHPDWAESIDFAAAWARA
jgi:endonuclease I/V8-like Glu-specific endopeptidase